MDFKRYNEFNDASALCGQFNEYENGFDEICGNCSHAVLKARDSVLNELRVTGNETEKEVCGFAVVTALASEIWNETSFAVVDQFYGCLRLLDVHGKYYLL